MFKLKIKIKLFDGQALPKIIDKGDWVDLSSTEELTVEAPCVGLTKKKETEDGKTTSCRKVIFDINYIHLGVAMQLPAGFEALIAPRSSTASKYGILQPNSPGVVDNCYCGDGDEWKMPIIPLRDATIGKGDRVCQFRILPSQKATFWQKLKWIFSSGIEFEEVKELNNSNRRGFGSTGIK